MIVVNILFNLIPKEKVAYIYEDFTIRQALEKMEYHQYTAVPVITESGKYVGILREGDILWYLKRDLNFDMTKATQIKIKDLPRRKDNKAIKITADMNELVEIAINQNFVPVLDDRNLFIGIVTRKDIMLYLIEKNFQEERTNEMQRV